MMRFSFRKGLRFRNGQRIWILQRRLATGKLSLEDESGELLVKEQKELLSLWLSGQFAIDDASLAESGSDLLYLATPRDLSTFDEKNQKAALRRAKYIQGVDAEHKPYNRPRWKEDIARVAAEIGDQKPPGATSVQRWWRSFRSTKSITKLVPKWIGTKRRPDPRYPIFEEAISEVFLTTQKKPRTVVRDAINRKIAIHNQSHGPTEQLRPIWPATVYRWLEDLEQDIVDAARLGSQAARAKYRTVVGSLSCAAILTRLEIDHTPLDLIVIDAELKLLLGRPWLTMAIDRCSRMPMGFYISFNAPSSHSVMQCLKRSILPKTEWLAKFPEVRGEWPVFGIPEQLACDNGMDLHSNALESTCSELLITLFFCPSKGPEWKGAMERFFRTMNVGLIHQLPGTVFSNVDERGDYPAEEKACIDIKVLVLLLTKWIVDVYAVTPHRGIGTTPLAKWSESAASRTIELPAYPLALDTITGIPAKRTLFHYGVELEGLHYNSRQLQAIRGRHGESIKADLKFTEETVGYIHVFDPDAKEYIKVDAIAQDYAANLPRQVHRLIRERTRARFGDNLSTENLLEARAEIEAIISEAIRGKKMALRKEGARFMMIDSEAVLAAAQPLVAAARPLRRAKAKGEVPRSVAPGLEDELPSYSELSAKKPDPAQG